MSLWGGGGERKIKMKMKIAEIAEKLTNEITSQLTKAGDKDIVTKEKVVEGCFPQASLKEKKAYMVTLGAIMDLGLLPEFQSVKRAGIKLASYVPKNSVMLAERAAARAVAKAEKAAAREAAKETAKAEKAAAREAARAVAKAEKAEKAVARKVAKETAKIEKAVAREVAKSKTYGIVI